MNQTRATKKYERKRKYASPPICGVTIMKFNILPCFCGYIFLLKTFLRHRIYCNKGSSLVSNASNIAMAANLCGERNQRICRANWNTVWKLLRLQRKSRSKLISNQMRFHRWLFYIWFRKAIFNLINRKQTECWARIKITRDIAINELAHGMQKSPSNVYFTNYVDKD